MKSIFLASLALAIFGLLAAWLLRRFRIESPLLHRLAWGLVLLQGIVFSGISFPLPLLDPMLLSPLPNQDAPALPPVSDLPAVSATPISAPKESLPAGNVSAPLSLSGIYFAGIFLTLSFFGAAYLALVWALRKTRPAPQGWLAQWNDILRGNGHPENSIPLQIHPRLGPMLCRLPRGYVVVVPEDPWQRLTPSQREAVLEHELAHVERRDIWKTLAARFVATLHWFNPIAWWSARQFEEAAEWDCDRRLSVKGKSHAVAYARALVEFAEPRSPLPIGASLARGAALSPRIRRLTSTPAGSETRLRRIVFAAFLLGAAVLAMLRFELIAQENRDAPEEDFQNDLLAFSENIDGSGEALVNFRETVKTPAGQIVMKELAAQTRQQTLEVKMSRALEDHLERFFDRDTASGKLSLKSSASQFKSELQKSVAIYSSDIEKLKPAVTELRSSLAAKSEAGKLLARFLDQEGAAEWIYAKALREKIRPGPKMIEDKFGGVLVLGKDGAYVIPPSRIEQAKKVVRLGTAVAELKTAIGDELVIFADEIASPDDFHEKVKATLRDAKFTTFVSTEMSKDLAEHSVPACFDKLFKGLEEGFSDRADGLHINPRAREDVARLMTKFENIRANLATASDAMARFANRMSEKDELHREIKKVLHSEVAVMLFARDHNAEPGDAGYAFRAMLAGVLESDQDGKRKVRKSEQEKIVANMTEALRTLREARRKGRQFDQLTAEIDEPELVEIYQSPVGKLIVGQLIREELELLAIDGLSLWIDQYFTKNDSGKFLPKARATEVMSQIVERSREISANLKSDF